MALHDTNKPQRAATASTINLFKQQQKDLNVNAASTLSQNKLDLDMFVQTAQKRKNITEQKIQSNISYGQQSSKIVAQKDQLQNKINESFDNPFHDLLAFFNGEASRDDLINEQRALTGKLGRINQDNVNTAKLFDEQIALSEQDLKDQLGFTNLRNKQSDQILKFAELQSGREKANDEFQLDKLRGRDRKTLVAESIDPNSIFDKGRVLKVIRELDLEELNLKEKRRKLKDKNKLSKDDVLGTVGTIELRNRVAAMKAGGVDTGSIDGVPVTMFDLESTIAARFKDREQNSLAITSLNQEALLQSTTAKDLLNVAKEQDTELMSPEIKAKFAFADTLNAKVDQVKGQMLDKQKNGIPVTANEFNVLASLQNMALFTSNQAKKQGAAEASARFKGDEVAFASATRFYETGRFDDAKDARNVFINLAQNETPSAIGNESLVFGKTLQDMANTLSDNLFQEFPDAPSNVDVNTGKAKLDINKFLEGNKVRKISFANSWNKMINKQSPEEAIANGAEPNFWVAQMSNSINTVQSEVAAINFLENPVVKLYPEFEKLLTNPGGGLKLDYLNADNGTMSQMANQVALLESKLVEKGDLTQDTDVFKILMEEFKSEATINVVSREFNRSSIALKAVLRPLYGRKQNQVESYMQTFDASLKQIAASNFPQQAQDILAEEKRLQLIKDLADPRSEAFQARQRGEL